MKHPYLEALMILIISVPYLLIVAPIVTIGLLFFFFINMEIRLDILFHLWSWPLRLARGDQ